MNIKINVMAKSRLLSEVRQEIRRLNYSFKTEQAYVGWIIRYVKYHGTVHPAQLGDEQVEEFLNHLANEGNVAASTQNQALSALVFLYRGILNKPSLKLQNLQRARKPLKIPVVLSTAEVKSVLAEMKGVTLLVTELMYGCGLRISEVLRLRVQDVDFEHDMILVRSGKGLKDRRVMLPVKCKQKLKEQMLTAKEVHTKDLKKGQGRALLPKALARKYKKEDTLLRWQYLFPSRHLKTDPRSKLLHRHHISARTIQKAIKQAVSQTTIEKKVTAHTFRHSFATHLLQGGYDIRTVQELLGHSNVKTTMIYTHVLNKSGNYVKSPVDTL